MPKIKLNFRTSMAYLIGLAGLWLMIKSAIDYFTHSNLNKQNVGIGLALSILSALIIKSEQKKPE